MKLPELTPADPTRAPGHLAVLEEFVNTLQLDTAEDKLRNTERAEEWFRLHGLLDENERVTGPELELAHEFRGALRALLLSNNGAEMNEGAVASLERVLGAATVTLAVASDGAFELRPSGSGLTRALGLMQSAVYEAMQQGTWQRFKACASDTCQWAFYDHSRNRSRTWCSMEICGNRHKVREHRRRNAGQS